MTVYAVIKVFDTLAEADRFAEQVTEDDIVAVFPLDAAEAPVNRDSLSAASAASSGPGDLGKGLPATLTAGESNRPAPRTGPAVRRGGRVAPGSNPGLGGASVIPFPGHSVKA